MKLNTCIFAFLNIFYMSYLIAFLFSGKDGIVSHQNSYVEILNPSALYLEIVPLKR